MISPGNVDNLTCDFIDFIVRKSTTTGVKNIIKIPQPLHPFNKKQEELSKIPQDMLQTIVEMYQMDFEIFEIKKSQRWFVQQCSFDAGFCYFQVQNFTLGLSLLSKRGGVYHS